MMGPMTYHDLIVLVPSHSLEDFPTELPEDKAEGLLNAFAVLWHPRLLAAARVLPSWHRADEPPQYTRDRLIIVPSACGDRLPRCRARQRRRCGPDPPPNLFRDSVGGARAVLSRRLPPDRPLSRDP